MHQTQYYTLGKPVDTLSSQIHFGDFSQKPGVNENGVEKDVLPWSGLIHMSLFSLPTMSKRRCLA
jgi:hypothetical protein